MIEFIVTIVYCINLIILSILFVKKAIFFFSNEEKFAGVMCICLSILTLFCSIYGGYKYYISQKQDFCPNCHYEYKTNEKFDYCPECNAKLINKCDSCNKYLPDSATDTCPYCGETINTKVGEIPESKKSSDEKQQYSKCSNCEKSLKDMKDIDNCPYCGFHLTHISTNKLTECQYCHRSLDGMEHIGDKCPYCGKEIEFKVSDIPNDSN